MPMKQVHPDNTKAFTDFTMPQCSYHHRSASIGKVDHSSLFHSEHRAVLESAHGRRRSMSTPPSLESLPSPTLSSICSPSRSNLQSIKSLSNIPNDASSQWKEGFAPSPSAFVMKGESPPGFRDVWMIKGVPLQLGLSRTL